MSPLAKQTARIEDVPAPQDADAFCMGIDLLDRICINPQASVAEAVAAIDTESAGIALVTNQAGHLIGTVTDGDVRRAILQRMPLNASVMQLLDCKPAWGVRSIPLTASVHTPAHTLKSLMRTHRLRHYPLLDDNGLLAGCALLHRLEEKACELTEELSAVIMAGGAGVRLRPLTQNVPKPMLPVGDKPLLEHIVLKLKDSGISAINISTHYLADQIMDYFGDGRQYGVSLNYVQENSPLGTAGALSLLARPAASLLVMNGDLLTGVDIVSMMSFHREHNALITAGVRQHDIQVPYGVVTCNGCDVESMVEKPTYSHFINAGVYIIEPEAWDMIPRNQSFNMPDLIHAVLQSQGKAVAFPIREYWIDIGQHDDYTRANAFFNEREIQKEMA